MQDLITALAKRYDGNPHIASIDARSCGNFGEWKPGIVSTVTAFFSFSETPKAAYLAIGLFSLPSITAPDIKLGNIGLLPNNWFPLQGTLQP